MNNHEEDMFLYNHIKQAIKAKKTFSKNTGQIDFVQKYCRRQLKKKKLTNPKSSSKMQSIMKNFQHVDTYVDLNELIFQINLMRDKQKAIKLKQQKLNNSQKKTESLRENQQNDKVFKINNKIHHSSFSLQNNQNQRMQLLKEKVRNQIRFLQRNNSVNNQQVMEFLILQLEKKTNINTDILKNHSSNYLTVLKQKLDKINKMDDLDSVSCPENQILFKKLTKMVNHQEINFPQPTKQFFKATALNSKAKKQQNQLLHKISTFLQIVLEIEHKQKWTTKQRRQFRSKHGSFRFKKVGQNKQNLLDNSRLDQLNKQQSKASKQDLLMQINMQQSIKQTKHKEVSESCRNKTIQPFKNKSKQPFHNKSKQGFDNKSKQGLIKTYQKMSIFSNNKQKQNVNNIKIKKNSILNLKRDSLKKHFINKTQSQIKQKYLSSINHNNLEQRKLQQVCQGKLNKNDDQKLQPIVNSKKPISNYCNIKSLNRLDRLNKTSNSFMSSFNKQCSFRDQRSFHGQNSFHKQSSFHKQNSQILGGQVANDLSPKRLYSKQVCGINSKQVFVGKQSKVKLFSKVSNSSFTFKNRYKKAFILNKLSSFIQDLNFHQQTSKHENEYYDKAINHLQEMSEVAFGRNQISTLADQDQIRNLRQFSNPILRGNDGGGVSYNG